MRIAELPGQTVNVDLCFVPLTHHLKAELPAISGSSGKLVFQSSTTVNKTPHYPGRVFEDDKLSYTSAMQGFISASRDKDKKSTVSLPIDDERRSVKEKQRIVHEAEVALRNERRSLRRQRKKEDAAWKRAREQRRAQTPSQAFNSLQWKQHREQRRQTVEQRKQEDIQWRHKRQQIKRRWSQFPVVTAWVAILVITDNCTRQCPGLRLFTAGTKVTAETVIDALSRLLPAKLQFLISDHGTQFRAKVFKRFAESQSFTHVLIAPHRPQSNGIAERFVRTLKQWLFDKQWQNEHQLHQCLLQFLNFYNNRPHQGLPGDLSPNELARRLN